MTTHNNGGPAFPVDVTYTTPDGIRNRLASDGMTLRDYFAARAMPVFLANTETTCEMDARSAYKVADAMLKAREKP